MNKTLLTLILCGLTTLATAQTASVEQSTFGIQTGLLGVWGHNEAKLTNQIALRSELGLDAGIYSGTRNTGFLMAPTITLEPRWYYNLNKRVEKSRRIDGNSGNFISLKSTYHSDVFVISSGDNVKLVTDISIVPTWGIRRNIGSHFNYEAGFGIGYIHYFKDDNVYLNDEMDFAVNLHLRIGYRF